ncbi:MAG: hypothetical protein ACI92G_003090 [Candidatus Pelagisphaera sp.]|jgi:hypothetical protein
MNEYKQCSLISLRQIVRFIVSLLMVYSASASSLIRTFDDGLVTLEAVPDPDTVVYAMEEQLPEDAYPRTVSHNGAYDPYLNKVKWGPFFDDAARILSYQIVSSEEIEIPLTGIVSWDGAQAQAAEGPALGIIPGGGFYGWILEQLGAEALLNSESDPAGDLDDDSVGLLGEFVFGLDPLKSDQANIHLQFDPIGPTLELSLQRRINLGEVSVGIWRSSDLQDWAEFDPGIVTMEDLGEGLQSLDYAWPFSGMPEFIQFRYELPE